MESYYHTPAEAFIDTCLKVNAADEVSPRGVLTRELLNVTLHIDDPMSIPFDVDGRDLNMRIVALEILQLLGQTPADSLVRHRVRAVADFQDYGMSYGNYGARIRGQLLNVIRELEHDPDSRRAVMSIYHGPADLSQDTLDVPCTLAVQFFIRDDLLCTRTTMRSNDAWLGLPYDLHQFCALHCAVAQMLSVTPGRYTHSVGSMHLYRKHWDLVEELGESISIPRVMLFETNHGSSKQRLEDITTFCQDVLAGHNRLPATLFEGWLINTIAPEP